MQAVHALGAQADEFLAPVRDQPQRDSTVIGAHFGEIGCLQADQGDGVGVDVVVLAAVAAGEHPHQRRSASGHVQDAFTGGDQPLGHVLADTDD